MMRFLECADFVFVFQCEADFIESLNEDVLSEFFDLEAVACPLASVIDCAGKSTVRE